MFRSVIKLSLPVILAQGIQTVMLLTDRYFLSLKNPVLAAAATMGGFLALSISLFFIHLLLFSTSLIAKGYGRNDWDECKRVLSQSLLIATLSIPLLLIISMGGDLYFRLLDHPQEYRHNEIEYFSIIIFSQIITLYRTCIESYLLGISKSKSIFTANLIGAITNVPLTYLFVIGPFSNYFPGASGAAWSTVLSNFISLAILYLAINPTVKIFAIQFNRDLFNNDFKTLLSQGSFAGLEKFTNSICFVTFVNMLVIYGNEVSTAISIVFTWDQIAFLPLMGMYGATMSIYSKFLGKGNLEEAHSSLNVSLQIAFGLMSIFSIGFWLYNSDLTSMMLKGSSPDLNKELTFDYASFFFKTTCLYIFANSITFLYKAALRSLGLSRWCFVVSLGIHLTLVVSCFAATRFYFLPPKAVWFLFMSMLTMLAFTFAGKYYLKRKELLKSKFQETVLV